MHRSGQLSSDIEAETPCRAESGVRRGNHPRTHACTLWAPQSQIATPTIMYMLVVSIASQDYLSRSSLDHDTATTVLPEGFLDG